MNGSDGSFASLQTRPHFLSGTSAATVISAPVVSGKSLNTSAAHVSSFNTIRPNTRAITSCSFCEIGASAMQLVYWRPEASTSGLPNASITAAPYTMVSDGYTLSVHPLHGKEKYSLQEAHRLRSMSYTRECRQTNTATVAYGHMIRIPTALT